MSEANEFFKTLVNCKECVPNFDDKGGWKFCAYHWEWLKTQKKPKRRKKE